MGHGLRQRFGESSEARRVPFDQGLPRGNSLRGRAIRRQEQWSDWQVMRRIRHRVDMGGKETGVPVQGQRGG